jgi:hypothetical protein
MVWANPLIYANVTHREYVETMYVSGMYRSLLILGAGNGALTLRKAIYNSIQQTKHASRVSQVARRSGQRAFVKR